MSKPEYQKWIESYAAKWDWHVRGHCMPATSEMVTAFPELRKVIGFVLPNEESKAGLPTADMTLEDRKEIYHPVFGLYQHAWCVTADGEIVDPTHSQFGSGIQLVYVEYDKETMGPLPSGRCPDCGEITFPEQNGFCDETCKSNFNEYMKEERGGA